jgi:hypothetical protein
VRSLFARFSEWKQASLLRRTVVTVAAFVMLACASIGTMSYAAVSATRAVFKPAPSASAPAGSAMAPGDVGGDAPLDGETRRPKTAQAAPNGAPAKGSLPFGGPVGAHAPAAGSKSGRVASQSGDD